MQYSAVGNTFEESQIRHANALICQRYFLGDLRFHHTALILPLQLFKCFKQITEDRLFIYAQVGVCGCDVLGIIILASFALCLEISKSASNKKMTQLTSQLIKNCSHNCLI